jgi:hypothetical protein
VDESTVTVKTSTSTWIWANQRPWQYGMRAKKLPFQTADPVLYFGGICRLYEWHTWCTVLPLAMAIAFSMVVSYFMAQTFVPIM